MRSYWAGEAIAVGIQGLGMYVPPQIVTADELAFETGIPAHIVREKFGVRQVHRADHTCHISDMAVEAARLALTDADVDPEDIDLLVYCGSEYKDFVVWSAAANIAYRLGCCQAEAYEVYALCAGTPITLRMARDMMLAEPAIRTVLVVAASKESELVNRKNERTRFMFNFGDGASAAILRRGLERNVILGSTSIVDGSLSEHAVMPNSGSRRREGATLTPPDDRFFDVPDIGGMRARLEEVSGPNFLRVVQTALRYSQRDRVDFLAAVHMKRSMQDWLQRELGAPRTLYLEEYGHMQAADQFIILDEARRTGLVHEGDVVALAAAGVGYTWAATILDWGKPRKDQAP